MKINELYRASPARYPELGGQVAIVTGSSRGIGAGIAARLAREGMRLVITGLAREEVEATAAELRAEGVEALAIPGDLRRDDAIADLFDRALSAYGTVNLLVNNAADLRRVRSEQLSLSLIDEQFAINTRAPLLCALRAAEIMRPHGSGSIINVSSVGGLRAHLPGLPYGITKGALDAMTRALAIDLAAYGIRVNGIAPGLTPSQVSGANADYLRELSRYIPLRKPGRPEDVGATAAFLASPDAAYITGQTFYVDGGLTVQLHPPEHPI